MQSFSSAEVTEDKMQGVVETIPKILHFIWLGPRSMPSQYQLYLKGWRQKHPAWEIRLWQDADTRHLPLLNREAFDAEFDPIVQADVLRYEIIASFGGIYADVDYECCQNFDKLIENVSAFVVSFKPGYGLRPFSNSLFGATANHLLPVQLVRRVGAQLNLYPTGPIAFRTGSIFFSSVVADCCPITQFAPPVFTSRLSLQEKPTSDCRPYAIHHSLTS
jgi:mannosyltransferase OCH1-like enzyme